MTGTSALPSANSTTECVGPGRATRPAWLSGWRGARPLVGPEHSRSEAGERRRHRLTRGNTNAQFGRHATSPGEYARATASAFGTKRSQVQILSPRPELVRGVAFHVDDLDLALACER